MSEPNRIEIPEGARESLRVLMQQKQQQDQLIQTYIRALQERRIRMSWEQFQAILQENRINNRIDDSQPPVACPIDGAVLDIHPRGRRNCPMGNYTWVGGAKLI